MNFFHILVIDIYGGEINHYIGKFPKGRGIGYWFVGRTLKYLINRIKCLDVSSSHCMLLNKYVWLHERVTVTEKRVYSWTSLNKTEKHFLIFLSGFGTQQNASFFPFNLKIQKAP